MILWPVVALIMLALAVGTVRYGLPALDHRKHSQALKRIVLLERELGIGQPILPLDQFTLDVLTLPAFDVAPRDRVFGQCESCRRRVALNAGYCHGGGAKCAKGIYRATLRP